MFVVTETDGCEGGREGDRKKNNKIDDSKKILEKTKEIRTVLTFTTWTTQDYCTT